MKFDFTGAHIFLAYLEGNGSVEEVLSHPAYRVVCHHADHWGGAVIDEKALLDGLEGKDSPFYGLSNTHQNIQAIEALLEHVQQHADHWSRSASDELKRLLPREDVESITVYPIIGYDVGIGLSDSVCMSLNSSFYQKNPQEFLSTMIHEGFHVLYERIHGGPRLDSLTSQEQWRSLFLTMLQNEGFAVYAPLKLRQERGYTMDTGHPLHRDYAQLYEPHAMAESISLFQRSLETITHGPLLDHHEYLQMIFGPQRLTYRVGCELMRRIESVHGFKALQQAVYFSGTNIYAQYGGLL